MRRLRPFVPVAVVALVTAAPAAEPDRPLSAPDEVARAGAVEDDGLAERAAERRRREDGLRALEAEAQASDAARERLADEVRRLSVDRGALASALVAAAALARSTEERVRVAEARLDELALREREARRSLLARRDAIGEVLAALQRLGHRPPPPLLVRADDVLGALRSGILLGAMLPELREEARRLALELGELSRLREALAAERRGLADALVELARERARLAGLVEARQRRLASAETELGGERQRGRNLAAEAGTMRDLIGRLDADAARLRDEREATAARERFAAAATREPARLAPRRPFATLQGELVPPVAGAVLRRFGEPDGSGGTLRGTALAARPRAAVAAPADGTVVFAGPFRTYGRLLIIDAGDGYYLLLAGLERATAEIGQFVLAGEPVGQMGEAASASAALGVVEADGPVLYVEVRKDGGQVDPGPWWAKTLTGRARG